MEDTGMNQHRQEHLTQIGEYIYGDLEIVPQADNVTPGTRRYTFADRKAHIKTTDGTYFRVKGITATRDGKISLRVENDVDHELHIGNDVDYESTIDGALCDINSLLHLVRVLDDVLEPFF